MTHVALQTIHNQFTTETPFLQLQVPHSQPRKRLPTADHEFLFLNSVIRIFAKFRILSVNLRTSCFAFLACSFLLVPITVQCIRSFSDHKTASSTADRQVTESWVGRGAISGYLFNNIQRARRCSRDVPESYTVRIGSCRSSLLSTRNLTE